MSSQISRQERETLKVINNAFVQAPVNLQYLKPYSLINVYICLTFKCLEESPNQQKGRKGLKLFIKLLIKSLAYHRVIIWRRITWKVFIRLIIISIFPPQYVVKILNRWPQLYNLSSFFDNMINHP